MWPNLKSLGHLHIIADFLFQWIKPMILMTKQQSCNHFSSSIFKIPSCRVQSPHSKRFHEDPYPDSDPAFFSLSPRLPASTTSTLQTTRRKEIQVWRPGGDFSTVFCCRRANKMWKELFVTWPLYSQHLFYIISLFGGRGWEGLVAMSPTFLTSEPLYLQNWPPNPTAAAPNPTKWLQIIEGKIAVKNSF